MHTQKYLEIIMLDILKKKSINKIRVHEILQELGMCKGTFYNHYGDKYDLLIKTFKNKFYDNICAAATDWESFMTLCLKEFKACPSIVINGFESLDVSAIRHYHENLLSDYITKDIKAKVEDLDAFTIYAIKICATSYTDIMLNWLRLGMKEGKEVLIGKMRETMPYSIYSSLYIKG